MFFFAEPRDKHLVNSPPWLQAARHSFNNRDEKRGDRSSVERIPRKLKVRANQFSNCFSYAEAETVETWLQAFDFAWNQLI